MQATKPSPQQLKTYLAERRESQSPPPSTERIREILGWHLLPNNYKEKEA